MKSFSSWQWQLFYTNQFIKQHTQQQHEMDVSDMIDISKAQSSIFRIFLWLLILHLSLVGIPEMEKKEDRKHSFMLRTHIYILMLHRSVENEDWERSKSSDVHPKKKRERYENWNCLVMREMNTFMSQVDYMLISACGKIGYPICLVLG